jgi:hypothetical protein
MTEWSTDQGERAARVWRALAGMYGARLVREFGEDCPEVWKAAIRRLSDRQIQRGLAALGNQGGERPPSLPGFVQACKTISPTEAASMTPRLEGLNYDKYHREGQLGLLTFIRQQGGVPPDVLPRLVAEKNHVVDSYRMLGEDNDPEAKYMPRKLRQRLKAALRGEA